MKPKVRTLWEEKLNKSNISNEDICDAVIKKAMEGIKSAPLNTLSAGEKSNSTTETETNKSNEILTKQSVESANKIKGTKRTQDKDDSESESLKKAKLAVNKTDQPARSSRSNNVEPLLEGLEIPPKAKKSPTGRQNAIPTPPTQKNNTKENSTNDISNNSATSNTTDIDKQNEITIKKCEPISNLNANSKPEVNDTKAISTFNIMEHICKIKVNGVGVLFQCKLCNRNFLKKEVVESHGCARNGRPKEDFTKSVAPPEPPKAPTVKYINTKSDNDKGGGEKKVNGEITKPQAIPLVSESKPKPKIGPASRVRRDERNVDNLIGKTITPKEVTPTTNIQSVSTPQTSSAAIPPIVPSIQFPQLPNLNSRYKLMPGPNNTFTLVEEAISDASKKNTDTRTTQSLTIHESPTIAENMAAQLIKPGPSGTMIKNKTVNRSLPPTNKPMHSQQAQAVAMPESQPYPVGLFKRSPVAKSAPVKPPEPLPFAIPASKKQSYTVVQTDNPSKLLISTKPQAQVEAISKKRSRKQKIEMLENYAVKQPFNVILEDAEPPKNAEFFTFVNVDPLLQPSYVLPTDSIIQESQISTSTVKQKQAKLNESVGNDSARYTCNMCGEQFNREKKLLTHIHMHYDKMDEEDQSRPIRSARKRGK